MKKKVEDMTKEELKDEYLRTGVKTQRRRHNARIIIKVSYIIGLLFIIYLITKMFFIGY